MTLEAIKFGFRKAKELPLILQEERTECGHACLVMIANSFGHHLSLLALRKKFPTSAKGTNLAVLSCIAEDLGLRTRALKISLAELKWVKTPAIVHWNLNHFVVLKAIKAKGIIIHDPAIGARFCSWQEVSNSFTGIALEFEKKADFLPLQQKNDLRFADIFTSIAGFKSILLNLLFLSFGIEIFAVFNPLFLQHVSDEVIAFNDFYNLYLVALAFSIFILFQIFIEYMRGHLIVYMNSHITEQFTANIMQHLLNLPFDFFARRGRGDIQSKFQGIERIQKKVSIDFITAILDGIFIIFNFIVMFWYSSFLSFFVALSLLLYGVIRYLSYNYLQQETKTSVIQHAKAASLFLESLQAILAIKCFAQENMRFKQWRQAYIDSLNADIKIARMGVLYQTANNLLFQIEPILVITIGAYLVLANQFTLGMLMAFLSYRLNLVNKTSRLIQNIFDYKLLKIELNRLGDIISSPAEIIDKGKEMSDCKPMNLQIKNISFRYHPLDSFIFKGIDLDIKPGEKIAIVGPSGCGKSTFLKVLMGLHEPTEGQIYINGLLLKDFGLKNFRQMIASVLQEDCLLAGSILENIAFFAEEINLEKVYEVCDIASIHKTIMQFPMSYETPIGELGSSLSGGQKQRILLARALYKNPKILFLDEATSHLDYETEKRINSNLLKLSITQIIVAHRQETIQMADRVLVINEERFSKN